MSRSRMLVYASVLEHISKTIIFPYNKVKLATAEELEKRFGRYYSALPPSINNSMKIYLGKVVTINYVVFTYRNFNSDFGLPEEYIIPISRFRIKEDRGEWVWSIWMLDFNSTSTERTSIFSHLQRFKKIKNQLERIKKGV